MAEVSDIRYARSGDIDIAYQVVGDGPIDLVYVSGFVSHLDLNWEFVWYGWMRRMQGLARIIMFDKRGTGLSDRSLGFGSLAVRMDDIRAVMDAAGVEKAVLYGVSEGGPLSILFAATYPQRVSRLIVYGSFARVRWAADYPIGFNEEVEKEFFRIVYEQWGTGRVLDRLIQNAPDPEEAERVLARFERNACTRQMAVEIMQRNTEIDIRPLLPAISVPTLVMHSAGDPMVSVEHGRYLAAHIPGAQYLEGPGNYHSSWNAREIEWIPDAITEFIGISHPEQECNRVLATVLLTDIVRSTQLATELGDRRWHQVLDEHDRRAREQVDRFRGRVVKSTGDGVLATFDGPARAIECTRAFRRSLKELAIDIRAGLHTGEVELRGEDIGGIAVHIASRVAALARIEEIWVSRTVKDLVTGSGIAFEDRGTHTLKGVPEDWQLYAVGT